MTACGWGGTVFEFLATDFGDWLERLSAHVKALLGRSAASEQLAAWEDEHRVLVAAFGEIVAARAEASIGDAVFEYELPLEGGRRADVVVLTGAEVVVLEFSRLGS